MHATPPSSSPKPTQAKGGDAELDALLRSATVEVPLPNSFQAEVWRRIAVKQDSAFPARFSRWLEGILRALVQPAGAAAAVAVTITAGAWLGSLETGAGKNDGKITYVQSISPFAAQAHEGGHP